MIELSSQEEDFMMKTPIAFATPVLAVGLAPVGSTVSLAAGSICTAAWQKNTRVSAGTGVPVGDAKAPKLVGPNHPSRNPDYVAVQRFPPYLPAIEVKSMGVPAHGSVMPLYARSAGRHHRTSKV
ncbi:hypothetical protein A5784_24165 [Mycobacterium sp. 852013-50091_SCH5140682]|uniref:hypothetical protein n=1 Tax=Mycobacterium sp. 852013-50091_SCH5140682 TaxID=1834109 RepID=UPI0007EB3A38|nr:hypothetical protein [Mycobacterium sp. 852013-50091_SCH5140682]OBC17481.1 hypothetical protein A5784_24165 [Mycobacterium sp. 852013-50091_SCH5140682]